MKPTDKQLEHIFFLLNDYSGRTHGEICRDIWNYVESELNKTYPFPKAKHTKDRPFRFQYKCESCGELELFDLWNLQIDQNVKSCTCPYCGAVHSEMVSDEP